MAEIMPYIQLAAVLQLAFLFVTGKAHDWPARICIALIPVTAGFMAFDVGARLAE